MLMVFVVFILFVLIGMPVGLAIGISGVFFFLQNPELPLITIVQLPISQTQNVTLLAVPLFIFAGNLMNSSGITDRLIKLSMLMAGHMKGGMAQVSVVLSTLMGAVLVLPMPMPRWRAGSWGQRWNDRGIRGGLQQQ